jgi:hypothetical protein
MLVCVAMCVLAGLVSALREPARRSRTTEARPVDVAMAGEPLAD